MNTSNYLVLGEEGRGGSNRSTIVAQYTYMIALFIFKLDGVGPVDNRPSTD